ncbi:MAG: M18 family aminopeptidase [Sandaracinaceae bacterium]
MADAARDLLAYIHASPTPWHAVTETTRRLEAAGYRELHERDAWDLGPGDKVYVVRGGSSVLAFELGRKPASEAGFRLVGAHTDSPNLRLKPNPHADGNGMRRLAVETYGGVLLHTWLDRDLSVAGRVVCRDGGAMTSRLVRFDAPLARVTSLAIHLQRGVNEKGLILNKQDHMAPLYSLDASANVVERVASKLGVNAQDIVSHDLCLYDTLAPSLGGADDEMVFAPRLDNLASCHAGLEALLSCEGPSDATRGVVFYDHEEVGSRSAQGADSPFLPDVLRRLARVGDAGAEAMPRAFARSFMISADMAHALHPNYANVHEPAHQPRLNHGPVIKSNANQRYATDGESSARFLEWARAADVPTQSFVTRSDLGCGSTIGPISAGRLGLRTIDVGNPMLSMHSCREMSGAQDVGMMLAVMRVFFERLD